MVSSCNINKQNKENLKPAKVTVSLAAFSGLSITVTQPLNSKAHKQLLPADTKATSANMHFIRLI